MIKQLALLLSALFIVTSNAAYKKSARQHTIGSDSIQASASVVLQLENGQLVPDRMTETERDAMTDADYGIIANTTSQNIQASISGTWYNLLTGANGIDDLTDVEIDTPLEGEAIVYDSASALWKNGTVAQSMDDLNDTSLSGTANRDLLVYDSASAVWKNQSYLEELTVVDLSAVQPGDTWVFPTTPNVNYRALTWGNDRWVAIARASTASMYSTDGDTWNTSTLPNAGAWVDVEYGAGNFVAVSETASINTVATSSDGTVWTLRTHALSGSYGLAFNSTDSRFLTVRNNDDDIAYSDDGGVTWSASANVMPSASQWRDVVWCDGTYVAVASGGVDTIAYSDDGNTWVSSATTGSFFEVACNEDTFVAVDYTASSNQVYVSLDAGRTFTARPTTGVTSPRWFTISYGNDYWAIASSTDGDAATSLDLTTWSDITPVSASNGYVSGSYSPDLGYGAFLLQTADTGYETTRIAYTDTGAGATQLVDVDGIINAVSYTGDGSQLTGIATNKLNTIPFSRDHSVAIWDGESGTNLKDSAIYISNDGVNTNLTTVGDISAANLTASASVSATNITASASVTAASFYGDGSNLTGLVADLENLTDTTIDTPSDNDILRYSSASSTWYNTAFATTHNGLDSLQGGAADEYYHLDSADYTEAVDLLDSLAVSGTDVTFSSSVTATGNMIATAYYGDGSNLTGVVSTLAALTDTTIDTPSDGDALLYSSASSTWYNGPISTTFDGLTDTDIASVADNDFIVYDSDSSAYVNRSNPLGTKILIREKHFYHNGWAEHGDTSKWTASAGTFAINTTTALNGDDASYDWTLPASASATLETDSFTVSASTTAIGYTFRYNYDGDDDDVSVYASCSGSSNYDEIYLEAGSHRVEGYIPITLDCEYATLKFQNHVTNSGKVVKFNGVAFYDNPFRYADLDNNTDWVSYTPTFTGFGTVSTHYFQWRRDGSDILIRGTFNEGTTTADTAKISLPSGLTIGGENTGLGDDAFIAGSFGLEINVDTNGGFTLAEAGETVIQFGDKKAFSADSVNPMSPVNGTSLSSGDRLWLEFRAPIEGWSAASDHVIAAARAGSEYFKIYNQENFWDGATSTYEWDHSLASPSFTTSRYITVEDDDSKTKIYAKIPIKLEGALSSRHDVDSGISVYDSAGNVLVSQSSADSDSGKDTNVAISVSLEAGDYIYFINSDPYTTRFGGISLNVTPLEVEFTAAIPVAQTAIISDESGSTTSFAADGNSVTLTLDTEDVSKSWLSLSLNQFTLAGGSQRPAVYKISWHASAGFFGTLAYGSANLYDVTNTATLMEGTLAGGASDSMSVSVGEFEVTLTSARTFEIKGYTDTVGSSASWGSDKTSIKGVVVSITKVK